MRRGGQVITGLAALAVLAGLLAGVPALLVMLAGNPISWPWADMAGALLRPDESGQLFIYALTLVGWGAWITFAASTLVEAAAQLRGRRTPRLRMLGPQQRLAAALVAAIAIVVAGPAVTAGADTPAYAAPPPATAAAAVSAPAAAVQVAPVAAAPAQQEQQAQQATYTVARGDYLSGIAARTLGDPNRYPELAALNPQLVDDPDHIEATWKLALPAQATDHGAQPHATGAITAPTPVPQQPTPAPPPAAAPGDSDPPGPAAPGTTDTAPPTTPAPTGSQPGIPTAPTPPGQAGRPAAPDAAAPGTATPPAPQTTPAPAPRPGESVTDGPAAAVVATVGGVSVLAALLLLALHRQRRRQQQHRRARQRIPSPRSGRAETRLRVAAAPANVNRLDHALRVLAGAVSHWPAEDLPDVIAVWVDNDAIHLVLAGPCAQPAPAPFEADGPTTWTLPATAELPEHHGAAAPLPTLVTVGSQTGQHLLLDLERLGVLTVDGHPQSTMDLLRYIAGELAHNTWSDDVRVTLAGFDSHQADLLAALNPDRVTIAVSIPTAVTRLRSRLAAARQTLQAVGAVDTVHGRVSDTAADSWMPEVLIVAQPDPQHAALIADLEADLGHGDRCGYAVVTTAPPAATTAGMWPVSVTADGQLHVRFLADTTITATKLPAAMIEPLADLMRTARAVGDQPTPPAADVEEWASGTDAAGGLADLLDPAIDDEEDLDPDPDRPDPDGSDPDGGRKPALRDVDPGDVDVDSDDTSTADCSPARTPTLVRAAVTASPAAHHDAATLPTVVTRPAPASDLATAAARRREREARDPQLDVDLAAWRAGDTTRPRIAILGPVTITAPGTPPATRSRFFSEVIVYLAARGARGASAAQLTEALWPEQIIDSGTRRAAITQARKWLGETPDGDKWLPDMGADQIYRLADGALLDWALFRRLRARGEARGRAGTADLRAALELVRAAPLDATQDAYATSRTPYAWLPDENLLPQNLTAAIVDTAHQYVDLCLTEINEQRRGKRDVTDDTIRDLLNQAQWAVDQAWLADPDKAEDQPWRDAMRIAHLRGRDSELRALLDDLMRHRDADVDEDLDAATYQVLLQVMPHLRSAS
jgi:nucleoid-associated protein YgaU